jgi:hypothetical protein
MSYINVKQADGTIIQVPFGKQGKSAYETWLDLGNTGTEQDFLDSLGSTGGLKFNLKENGILTISTKEE